MQKKDTSPQATSAPSLRFGLRLTRVLAVVRVIVTVVVALALAVTALAVLDNAQTPTVQLNQVARGPAALSAIRDMEFDPISGSLYAASNAGVFKSIDGGLNWLPISTGLSGVDAQDLMVDQQTGDVYVVMFGSGLSRSSDGGRTWNYIGRGFRGSELLSVAYDVRVNTLYAGLRGYGMWISVDNGQSWKTIGMGLSNTDIRQLVVGRKPGEVFAATDLGVYHSVEVSSTWDLLTGKPGAVSVWSLALDQSDGTVYAGTEQGVQKIQEAKGVFAVNLTGMTQGTVQALTLDAHNGVLYAGTLTGVYRSADAAKTWTPLNKGLNSTLVRALLRSSEGGVLFAGTDSGIYRSDDEGNTWQASTVSPSARHAQALLVNQVNDDLYAGTLGGGVFKSSDSGAKWAPMNIGLRNTVVQSLGIDHGTNTIYAATRKGIYRSNLDAISWSQAEVHTENLDVQTLAVDERKGAAYAVNANGYLLRSGDSGRTWDVAQPLTSVFVRAVAVSSFSSAVYVGTYKGGVMVSTDGGFNFHRAGNLMADRNIETLAVDERNGVVYAGTLSGKVYGLMADGGAWQLMTEGGLPGNVIALALNGRSNALFAVLKAGIFRLLPGESAWNWVTFGMAHTDAMALAVRDSDEAVFVGTMAGGVYRSTGMAEKWELVSGGLTDIDMRGIVADDATGAALVSATGRGAYRFDPQNQTWQVSNIGLHEMSVRGMASAEGGIRATLVTSDSQYLSDNNGAWRAIPRGLGGLADMILPGNAYGYVGRLPGGEMLWAARGGGEIWARTAANLGLVNATIRQLPDGRSQVLAVWGAELSQSEPGTGYTKAPLAWMLVRMGYWTLFNRLAVIAPWWWIAPVALASVLALLLLLGRRQLSVKYGVPWGVAFFLPRRSAKYAKAEALEKVWPRWERAVRSELYAYGDVRAIDLPAIPGPFRLYAMQRYATAHSDRHAVTLERGRLRAQARGHMSQWVQGWSAMRADIRHEGAVWRNRKRVDPLADALASSLDLQRSQPTDNDSVRAYSTTPTMDTAAGLPPLALLFVADNETLKRTVDQLVSALDGLSMPGAIGLVISAGRPGRSVDVTIQIRNAVKEFGMERRMAVFSGGDIVTIMAAGDPVETLMARLPR